MNFLIKYGLLPILFLMCYAMGSDAFRFAFGIDLSMLLVIAFDVYYLFMYKNRIRGGLSYSWWLYLLVVPTVAMTILEGGDMQQMLCSTCCLMLPFALEPFVPGNDKQILRGFFLTFVVSAIILLLYSNFGFLSNWNTNCIAYLTYMGIAGAAVILSENRKNVVVWVFLGYTFIQLMVTQSRNVMSALVIVILLVMFKKTISKKIPYTVISILSVLYPALFPIIITKVSKGTPLYTFIRSITEDSFDKNSVFSGRDAIFPVAEEILEASPFNNILGFGNPMTKVLAVHNDYYMIRYAYGIIGTIIIAALLFAFFKNAYTLIQKGDNITFGCVAVIVGVLFQQASEGWFLATPLVVLMAFVYMAIVIKRYRMSEGKHLKNENL